MINPEFLVDNHVTLYRKDDKTFPEQGAEALNVFAQAYPQYFENKGFTLVYELVEDRTFGEEARLRLAIKNPNYIPLKLPFTRLEFTLAFMMLGDLIIHVVGYNF